MRNLTVDQSKYFGLPYGGDLEGLDFYNRLATLLDSQMSTMVQAFIDMVEVHMHEALWDGFLERLRMMHRRGV